MQYVYESDPVASADVAALCDNIDRGAEQPRVTLPGLLQGRATLLCVRLKHSSTGLSCTWQSTAISVRTNMVVRTGLCACSLIANFLCPSSPLPVAAASTPPQGECHVGEMTFMLEFKGGALKVRLCLGIYTVHERQHSWLRFRTNHEQWVSAHHKMHAPALLLTPQTPSLKGEQISPPLAEMIGSNGQPLRMCIRSATPTVQRDIIDDYMTRKYVVTCSSA